MSDVEGAAPYDDGEERREKKKKDKDKDKDKKKHRTPEEKEARRARKAAKAAASAQLDGIISDANLDDDANETGTPGRVTESTESPAASKKSPAAKPKAAWGDVEKGSRGGSKSSTTDGGYVKPARTDAAAHAQTVNVFRQKMGVDVHIKSDVLEPYDEDDILSQIYNECERKGIVITPRDENI